MITTPLTAPYLHGVAEVETTARGLRPHRLPAWVRVQFPDPQLLMTQGQPSGVRLAMTTAARTLHLVTHSSRIAYAGVDRPRGSVDLVVDGDVVASDLLDGGDVTEVDLQTGATSFWAGLPHTTTFSLRGAPPGAAGSAAATAPGRDAPRATPDATLPAEISRRRRVVSIGSSPSSEPGSFSRAHAERQKEEFERSPGASVPRRVPSVGSNGPGR